MDREEIQAILDKVAQDVPAMTAEEFESIAEVITRAFRYMAEAIAKLVEIIGEKWPSIAEQLDIAMARARKKRNDRPAWVDNVRRHSQRTRQVLSLYAAPHYSASRKAAHIARNRI